MYNPLHILGKFPLPIWDVDVFMDIKKDGHSDILVVLLLYIQVEDQLMAVLLMEDDL